MKLSFFYITPKGFHNSLDDDQRLAIQQACAGAQSWWEDILAVPRETLGVPSLYNIESNHPLSEWVTNIGDAAHATLSDNGFAVDTNNLNIILAEDLANIELGAYAGSFINSGLSVLGDAMIDVFLSRYFWTLFKGTPGERLTTYNNQLGSLCHEIGHQLLDSPGHVTSPINNIMGNGIWSYPSATVADYQIAQIRARLGV